jgi:hypothetical protein
MEELVFEVALRTWGGHLMYSQVNYVCPNFGPPILDHKK